MPRYQPAFKQSISLLTIQIILACVQHSQPHLPHYQNILVVTMPLKEPCQPQLIFLYSVPLPPSTDIKTDIVFSHCRHDHAVHPAVRPTLGAHVKVCFVTLVVWQKAICMGAFPLPLTLELGLLPRSVHWPKAPPVILHTRTIVPNM